MKKLSGQGTLLFLLLCAPQVSLAYLGPGSGVGAIGSLIALAAVVLVAIAGFVYFPIKRRLDEKRPAQSDFVEIEEESE